ncbi:hypothetical protein PGB90_006152 [Kerria lacca]
MKTDNCIKIHYQIFIYYSTLKYEGEANMSKILKYSEADEKSEETNFVEKLINYVKCNIISVNFHLIRNEILNMEVRDDDIWVCSFPKLGTTWTQEMVWCIANNVNLEAAKSDLNERFPSLEKAHLPYNLLPIKLQQNVTNAKIVFVIRDPRDVCISYFHFLKLFENDGNFEEFCQMFLDGRLTYGSYWDHRLSYWNQRHSSNVLILKFEDMKNDLKSVIHKTANFLGKNLTDTEMKKVLDHLSFERMKENHAVNQRMSFGILEKYDIIKTKGSFIRCGKVDQWKTVMNFELEKKFEKWEKENLRA